ncbi:S41 family peptidase [Arachidicoccus ginsenosidivorans]|uniref:PDZ domain-containing protein n=1 Tax=Arachidicoccus ginsenosidivorans TaxID=496057 RepID=A0A5B8VGB5_9BACT|nr:S41 family peptidase [Arachidicoccus ginsenosidivorans]QEC70637.1 PDZ domain-containing protein [Arachidicoccus ginsenosidivorans]
MKKTNLKLWLPFLLSIMIVLGMVIGYKLRKDTIGPDSFIANPHNTAIGEVVRIIDKMYVKGTDKDSLEMKAINALLSQLDPFSIYISAQQLKEINDKVRGSFVGIGIGFEVIQDTVAITNVVTGSPADKAGVKIGDQFLRFNDTIQMSGPGRSDLGVVNILEKVVGKSFKVLIKRNHKEFTTTLHKAMIPIFSVDAAYMLDPKTGYVKLNQFSETTYREFMLALEKLKKAGMQQLLIDLRGNSGGVLTAATEIANEFLADQQLIVYTDGDKVGKKEYRCKRDGLYKDLKLAVLVDETTASASEVLAGALQDWDRATIIGRRTFGKGLVQDQFNLTNGGAMRLTVAKYFTPLGRNIQKPYDENTVEYQRELTKRVHSGQTVLGDTSSPTGKAYKTPKGNTVYGGGGITPDDLVAYDTTKLPPSALDLFLKGTLTRFTFLYYMHNRAPLDSLTSSNALFDYSLPKNEIWDELSEFALTDSIHMDSIQPVAKENILEKFKAFLAKDMFGPQGYFEINNHYDNIVTKGLQVINQAK